MNYLLSKQPQDVQNYWLKNQNPVLLNPLSVLTLNYIEKWHCVSIDRFETLTASNYPYYFALEEAWTHLGKVDFKDSIQEIDFNLILLNSVFVNSKQMRIKSK